MRRFVCVAFAVVLLAAAVPASARLTEEEAFNTAVEAYIYGYPLITMEMTRRVMTNATTDEGKLAPMGWFANLRSYPTPSDKAITTPIADTLYSSAWIDLSSRSSSSSGILAMFWLLFQKTRQGLSFRF